jgi:hypothetical protein
MASFEDLLELYRTNFVNYKVTGIPAYKSVYERAQDSIERHLQVLSAKLQADSQYINETVDKYQKTNPELAKLSKEMKSIQQEGPKLQDKYETEKRLQAAPDTTYLYIKGGVVLGLIGIGVIASLVFPENINITSSMSSATSSTAPM